MHIVVMFVSPLRNKLPRARARANFTQGESACVAQIESFCGALPVNQLRPC